MRFLNAALMGNGGTPQQDGPIRYRLKLVKDPFGDLQSGSNEDWREWIGWWDTGDWVSRDTAWDWKHGPVPQQMLLAWLVCAVPDLLAGDVDALFRLAPWEPQVLLEPAVSALSHDDLPSVLRTCRDSVTPPDHINLDEYVRDTLDRAYRKAKRCENTDGPVCSFLSDHWHPARRELLLGALLRDGDPVRTEDAIGEVVRRALTEPKGRRGERTLCRLRESISELVRADGPDKERTQDVGLCLASCEVTVCKTKSISLLLGGLVRDGVLCELRLTVHPTRPAELRAAAKRILGDGPAPVHFTAAPSSAAGQVRLWNCQRLTDVQRGDLADIALGVVDRSQRWLFEDVSTWPIRSPEQVAAAAVGRTKPPWQFVAVQRQLDAFVFTRAWETQTTEQRMQQCVMPLLRHLLDPEGRRREAWDAMQRRDVTPPPER